MITHRPLRGLIGGLALTLVVTGLTAVATGSAANAAPHHESAESVHIGWTDSATPRQSYDADGQNMPLGTSVDASGQSHTSRVYATFDIARFKGDKIYSGTISIQESSAADCTKRAIEIWRTKPIGETPTWKRAPKPLAKLDEILTSEFCPRAHITFDVGSAVQDAVKRKQKRITFEIRVPRQYEADPAYGRQLNGYRSVGLTVGRNSVPKINNKALFNGGVPCVTEAPYPHTGGFANLLQAVATDADDWDDSNLRTEVAIWPTNDPTARTIVTSGAGRPGRAYSVNLPEGMLADGQTYGWQARAGDGLDVSKWSKHCYFTYDATAPSAPTVTSPNYPADPDPAPVGEPAVFTFSGNGDTDIVGFQYAWHELPVNGCEHGGDFGELVCRDPLSRPGTVAADVPGGTATVTLSGLDWGRHPLQVRAIDRAGNVSTQVQYAVFVPSSDPRVEVQNGTPRWGQEVVLKFTPANGVTGVRTYEVKRDRGEAEIVQAEADGTGSYRFVADDEYGHQVTVRSVSTNDFVSAAGSWSAYFDPWPGVTSDVYHYPPAGGAVGGVGVEGSFTFYPVPGWTDTASYRYEFRGHGGEPIEVAAEADGTATITWTPQVSGAYELIVWAVRADGSTESNDWFPYYFEVA